MIKTEYYMTRSDGVALVRTYSDAGKMIRKVGTDEVYAEAIDHEGSGRTYTETDVDIQYSDGDSGAVDEPDNP